MQLAPDAAPAVRAAFAEVVEAVQRLATAVRVSQSGDGVDAAFTSPWDDAGERALLACDADALAVLQALEAVDAAVHVERARALVAAAGEVPEVLSTRHLVDPSRDSRVSDVRAVELAAVLSCTPNRARILLHEARIQVTEVPRVLEAVAAGLATPFQARLASGAWRDLVNRHGDLDPDAADDLARRFQDRVLRRASSQTVADFKRTLGTAVAALSPAPTCTRPDPREQRRVTVQSEGNGMAWLSAYLDIVSAHRVMQVLEHAARNDRSLLGTMAQRAADALVAIVDGDSTITAEQRSQAAEVQVLVSLDAMVATVAAWRDGSQPLTSIFGELVGSGHVVEGDALLRLFRDSRFRRLVVCEQTGRLLDFGRETYRPPAALRDHVVHRDRTCRVPGCVRPARYGDIDHTTAWEHGGVTSHRNLAALCRTHHVLKTHGRWQYVTESSGDAHWRTPGGVHLYRPAGEFMDHVGRDTSRPVVPETSPATLALASLASAHQADDPPPF